MLPEVPVGPDRPGQQQLPVGTDLDHSPGIDDDDTVEVGDSRQPVGHDQGRGPGHEPPEGLLDVSLRLGVERAGGLVQDQHRGRLQHGLSDGDALDAVHPRA